jgi:PiT family inorganic phosphate transporter
MGWTFGTYIILKGLNRVWKVGFLEASLMGLGIAPLSFAFTRWRLANFQSLKPMAKKVLINYLPFL